MATLRTYKCKKCGYEVRIEPKGRYSLILGDFYNFSCSKCKEIVDIPDADLYLKESPNICPLCHSKDSLLQPWNPIKGRCPKCNSKMKIAKNIPIVAAD